MVSHGRSFAGTTRMSVDLYEHLHNEVDITLRVLLDYSLKSLLDMLQSLMSRQNRSDWPAINLALCLLFFAIESMQVDIYLRSERADLDCQEMDESAILMVTEIYKASTAGFNPLSLDWDEEENAMLVAGNFNTVETLRNLQCLSQEYCEFRVLYAGKWIFVDWDAQIGF